MKPWPPTLYTEPLTARFESLFGRYKAAFRHAWDQAFGYMLEDWQERLLEAITELRADGSLRYRQVLVSMGRQNGKTEIGAALALLRLLSKGDALVIGIASSAEQARLVYDRAMKVIGRNPAFAKRFDRLTDTRGLSTKAGGRYELKAAKSAALQGLPIDLGVVDEVHLLKAALWNDLVNGTGDRPDTMVVGITTAGDDDSELLKHLYEVEADSFGRFIWEAPQASVPESDKELAKYLAAANPAIASGRRDVAVAVADSRTQPPADVIRYRLNRFVARSTSFLPADAWMACADETRTIADAPLVFAVDRTTDWGFASVAVAARKDGVTYTQLVASIASPTLEQLVNVCLALAAHSPALFVVDGYALRDLGNELKRYGFPVRIASQADVCSASAGLYAKVAGQRLRHGADPILSAQVPRAGRKNVGEAFRISRADSAASIDAVMATAFAAWGTELDLKPVNQLFI